MPSSRGSFAAALLLLAALPASAQRVSGVVRDSASGRGLPGAVVIVTSAQNATLARTLSGADGRYSLPLAAPAIRLRVLRLGYRPKTFELALFDATTTLTRDVALASVPTLLTTVSVIDQPSCPRADDSQGAASLWEQARSALLASVVAREARPAQVTNLTYERALLPKDSQVVYQRTSTRSGRAARSFQTARSPAEMNRTGYTGMRPAGLVFDIPDEEVLLDESFAATHCFHVRHSDDAHAGEVGLAFEPAPDRDELVDVRGVLWLDPNAPALRSLAFRYTHLDPAAIEAGAGGTIHFQTMSNGVVVISDWTVMLPALEEDRDARRSVAMESGGRLRPGNRRPIPMRVVQFRETGGVLLDARWPDSVVWHAPMGSIEGHVVSTDGGGPLSRVLVTLAGTSDTLASDDDGRFRMSPTLAGRYVVQAADTSFSFALPARTTMQKIEVAPAGATAVSLALASRSASLARICPAGDDDAARSSSDTGFARAHLVATLVGRVALPGGTPLTGMHVTGRWQADYVLGSREGDAIGIRERGGDVDLDAAGRFLLCHVATQRPVLLQLGRASAPLADTLIMIPGDSALWAVEWHPAVSTAKIAAAAPARFRGVVRRASDQAPVAGVEVWLPAIGRRATTDTTGVFSFDTLPAGPTLVQTRRVGYLVQRDTLTLAAGKEIRRDFVLDAQATLLDTVRTLANRMKYVSPMLQGFEERRAQGAGHFITEEVFRENDERNLASVLLSRVPGITLLPAPHGGSAIVSTRKPCGEHPFLSCKPCFVTVFLDGALLYDASFENGPPPPDASRFRNAELAGAEYYGGGGSVPAQFNRTSSGCGTLLLWTRER
jgi:hypothetical protein